MLKTAAATLLALACAGCATMGNDNTQPMRLDTRNAKGDLVAGADCKVSNDHGSISVKSGDTAQVRRSGNDLDIKCTHPENPEASARAISRASAGRAGSAILGLSTGALYSYPGWVQLVFGKTLVFDRSWEKDGQPVPGAEAAGYK